MKSKILWGSWIYLFAQCAVLGFVPTPPVALKILFGIFAVAFFVPPFLLIRWEGKKAAKPIAIAAGVWLVLTVGLIIANYASSLITGVAGRTWGQVLNIALGILSTPMYCGQIWLLSLFGWAFLLHYGIQTIKTRRK